MLYDFHTHTFLSDGSLSPIELIRRASVLGYHAIALTDHVGLGSLDRVLKEIIEDCRLARQHWDILALPGVEITHVPPEAIDSIAKQAKELGAWIVVVHGETVTEPVPKGTNLAAIESSHVDLLAHPGLLTLEEARLASQKGTFIEISGRPGHAFGNGHVVKVAREAKAQLLLNSDAHDPHDLLSKDLALAIAHGAGLNTDEVEQILLNNPTAFLDKRPLPPLR